MNKPLSVLAIEFVGEQDVNTLSKTTYKRAINKFVKWVVISGLNFWELKRKDIIAYKSYLIDYDLSVYTIDLYLTVIRKFYLWLDDCGLYENIAAGVRSPRRERRFKKGYLTADQVDKLLNSIDCSTLIGMRDRTIIALMVFTGLRRVEVCRMNVSDIIKTSDNIVVRIQRKGHTEKDSKIGIPYSVYADICNYIIQRHDPIDKSMPLFVSHAKGYKSMRLHADNITRMVKNRLTAIGIVGEQYTCHSLRHTAAILALKAGASIYDVQQMLGHTDIKTTTIYLRAIDEETRINNRAVRLLDEVLSKRLNQAKSDNKHESL